MTLVTPTGASWCHKLGVTSVTSVTTSAKDIMTLVKLVTLTGKNELVSQVVVNYIFSGSCDTCDTNWTTSAKDIILLYL